MEIGLAILPTPRINNLRVLCKNSKTSPGTTAKRMDLDNALRAWEEDRGAQAQLAQEITHDSGDEEDGRGRASTNGRRSSSVISGFQARTRKEEVEKRPATASGGVEGVEEENCEEERSEPGETYEEFGEWFLPSRGEKNEEAADGGLQPAVARRRNPESNSGEAWLTQVRDHAIIGRSRGREDGRSGIKNRIKQRKQKGLPKNYTESKKKGKDSQRLRAERKKPEDTKIPGKSGTDAETGQRQKEDSEKSKL
ncbi:hypothetical protein NDU88_001120 [Pleurodeles waltl]|uniref:Uncharacterized protein n=1 Tax=Pleurodeles waltl TaxID=8319 RepID=A0AAV7SAR1_PLEWA|nr:hypothetical protein NDU88_001120 [Pleurodeles waltl]